MWDDILTSRLLYIDSYKMLFNHSVQSSFDDYVDNSLPEHQKDSVRDIRPILYAQCAKGAFKMGMYDSCDKYL